jgi:hypothetical protein
MHVYRSFLYVVKYWGLGLRGSTGLLRDHICEDLPTMRIQPQRKWLLESESVTLRLVVYRQSVRLGVRPLEAHDQRFFLFNWTPYVTSSLARRWVCLLRIHSTFRQVYISHCFTHKSSVSTGFTEQIMPNLQILCYNENLVIWTVISLTTAKYIICSTAQKGHLNSQNVTIQILFHTELHFGSLWNNSVWCFLCCNFPLNMTAEIWPFSQHPLKKNKTAKFDIFEFLHSDMSNLALFLAYFQYFGNIKGGSWDHFAVCVSVYAP